MILKNPISKLILGITKFKYKDVEMNFNKKLSELESALEEDVSDDEDINKDDKKEINTVAKVSPSAAISLAWSLVEREINSTIMRLAISPDYPPYNSAMKNINILEKNNLIDEDTYNRLNEMRQLRNKAVHLVEDEISYSEAIRYYEIAMRMMMILKSIKKEN